MMMTINTRSSYPSIFNHMLDRDLDRNARHSIKLSCQFNMGLWSAIIALHRESRQKRHAARQTFYPASQPARQRSSITCGWLCLKISQTRVKIALINNLTRECSLSSSAQPRYNMWCGSSCGGSSDSVQGEDDEGETITRKNSSHVEHFEGLALLSTTMIDIFFCSTVTAYGALYRAIITAGEG